jgi:hypothetical protein
MSKTTPAPLEAWPALPYAAWQDTCSTVHLWSQIVGKIRLSQTPWLNHAWQVALYVTSRGLTTSPIPHGARTFELSFDFIDHRLRIDTSEGHEVALPLEPQTVADFYARLTRELADIGFPVAISELPCELPEPIRFSEDRVHGAYDPEYARRFGRVLSQVDRVFKYFRSGFIGKDSPVHFFWGSFDLAVTRFSGRRAPLHPGGVPHLPDAVAREAYSHEVSSAGFWPGGNGLDASFYSYAYPTPPAFSAARVHPQEATWNAALGEFILPYASVRSAADPEGTLLAFLRSTYEAAAQCGSWDRAALDCALGSPGVVRSL